MKQEKQYQQLFSHLAHIEPNKSLEDSIMNKVYRIQKIHARIHTSIHALFVLIAIIGFVPAIQLLINNASQSGFIQYASLGLSDGITVLGSWRIFALSVIESAPIFEIGVVLGLIVVFIYFVRSTARSASFLVNTPRSSHAS